MSNPTPVPPADPPLPDYGGAWIGAVGPGLLAKPGARPPWFPTLAREAERTVLLVLDGLGHQMLDAHSEDLPTLSGMAGTRITSVTPTTTATGLTSITTGLPPAQHGIMGYAMRVGGEVLQVLSWRTLAGKPGPTPETVQPTMAFGGRKVPLVTKGEFRRTGFTKAHLRGGRLQGWRTTAILVELVRQAVRGGAAFTYAYYDGIDKVAHEFGLGPPFFTAELRATDRLVAEVSAALPDDVALVVTSDHGHVEVGSDGHRSLQAVAGLVSAYAGEGRFRSLFARSGASRDLREACQEQYGDVAWVLSRDQLFDGGWFGPGASMTTRGRVGDVVLAAREPVAFLAPPFPDEKKLRSWHGSLTEAELGVPLLAGPGTGG